MLLGFWVGSAVSALGLRENQGKSSLPGLSQLEALRGNLLPSSLMLGDFTALQL